MKIIAVIPVKGRIPLLKYTIGRLLKKNGVSKVICVGDEDIERKTCEAAGAEFLFHENNPLGKKWNAGFLHARQYEPDACLFVGSGDWISDNWLDNIKPHLKSFDLIGKKDFYMIDFSDKIRICHWLGYDESSRRSHESIGIGRVISARILDKMDWQPFDDTRNHSMDFFMYQKVLKNRGKDLLLTNEEMISLSVSTSIWANKHQFEKHWQNQIPSFNNKIIYRKPIFDLFPEAENFYADISK